MQQLLVDSREPLLRSPDFDAEAHPRTRSYEGAQAFIEQSASTPAPPGSRFAGRLAAVYGSDRQWLGKHASAENVEALVHKALMLVCADERCDAEVVFVVDTGAKAATVARYVATLPRSIDFAVRSHGRAAVRTLHVRLSAEIIDAATSAIAALPTGIGQRLLLIDVGHFRTKMALLSGNGCERQEQLELGVADCVRRVLRDGQDQGLVADEFAVVRALENARGDAISIGERRFDIGSPLESARRALEEELARGVRRLLLEQYERCGDSCHAAAIIGGGAASVGAGLAARLEASAIGLRTVWVTPDPSFLLVEGARQSRG